MFTKLSTENHNTYTETSQHTHVSTKDTYCILSNLISDVQLIS